MHRPPHLRDVPSSGGAYPIDLPIDILLELTGDDEERVEEMVEVLSEGAPHDVMSNILILHIAEAFLNLAKAMPERTVRGARCEDDTRNNG
jgi:hypothetical protein